MAVYTIKDLERLSGIKAHTIRIWEKRYQLLKPVRTDTNIRSYSDTDLKQLLNVVMLYQNGFKISKIAQLSDTEKQTTINELELYTNDTENWLNKLLIATINFDEEEFETLFNKIIIQKGFVDSFQTIIHPFLLKIGILWQTDSILVAHEHFLSNIIRKKLFVATDALHVKLHQQKEIVLFLPEGEWHELTLLYYNYLLKKNGYKTYYLGQSTPFNEVSELIKKKPAVAYIIFSLTNQLSKRKMQSLSAELHTAPPNITILTTGAAALKNTKQFPERMIFFKNPENLQTLIQ